MKLEVVSLGAMATATTTLVYGFNVCPATLTASLRTSTPVVRYVSAEPEERCSEERQFISILTVSARGYLPCLVVASPDFVLRWQYAGVFIAVAVRYSEVQRRRKKVNSRYIPVACTFSFMSSCVLRWTIKSLQA